MRCPYCNAENKDNAVFCVKCDKWILGEYFIEAQPAVEAAPAATPHQSPLKRFAPLLFSLSFLVAALAIFLWPGAKPAPTTTWLDLATVPDVPPLTSVPITVEPPDPGVDFVTCHGYIGKLNANGKLAFVVDDHYVETSLSYYMFTKMDTSLDGRTGALLSDGVLLYIRNDEVVQVAENIANFELSTTGDGIAYKDRDGGLWLYHDGQSVLVYQHDDVDILTYAISPDGGSVAYTTRPKVIVTSYYPGEPLMLYQDGTTTALGNFMNCSVLGVTEGGEWMYVYSDMNLFIVDEKGNVTELGRSILLAEPGGDMTSSSLNILPSIHFNCDYRQVMYFLGDGTYLSVDGQPGVKVSERHLTPIVPEKTRVIKESHYATYPHRDLRSKLYWANVVEINDPEDIYTGNLVRYKAIYYVDSTLASQEVLMQVEDFWLDPSGMYLYCTYLDGMLAHMEGFHSGVITTSVITINVDAFVVSHDTSVIYYRSEDKLFRLDTDTASSPNAFAMSISADTPMWVDADGMFAYYTNEKLTLMKTGIQMLTGTVRCFQAENGRLYCYTSNGSLMTFTDGGMNSIWYPSNTD